MSRSRRSNFAAALGLAAAALAPPPALAQTGPQIRIVSYNVAQMQGSPIELRKVFQSIAEDPTPLSGVIRVPDVYVFQEVQGWMLGELSEFLDSAAPIGVSYRLATFTANGGGGENALFHRVDSIVENPGGHRDIVNHNGPRATDRWQLRSAEDPGLVLYVYGSHFKGDVGPENASQRESEADAVRRDADSLGASAHVIYCGDWNVYSPSESAFERFFAGGAGRAVDPRFNRDFTTLSHTQSPHDGSNSNLIGGGMDDRFDFQLCSEELADGQGLDMIADSYRALGNDGQHYNRAINFGHNYYFGPAEQWKARALALASDHLPLAADYLAPVPRLHLDVEPLVAGLFATLRVQGAAPNEMVYFMFSTAGLGTTPAPPLGVTLGLRSPVLAGSDRADGDGRASLRGRVPVQWLDREVWLQAAQRGALTDVVRRLVE